MPPWEYTEIEPRELPSCPWCHKPDAVKLRFDKRDHFDCETCGTAFVAKWRPA